jgi:hypothetical protein
LPSRCSNPRHLISAGLIRLVTNFVCLPLRSRNGCGHGGTRTRILPLTRRVLFDREGSFQFSYVAKNYEAPSNSLVGASFYSMQLGPQFEGSFSISFKPVAPSRKVGRKIGHWGFLLSHQALSDQVSENFLPM